MVFWNRQLLTTALNCMLNTQIQAESFRAIFLCSKPESTSRSCEHYLVKAVGG